jgi:hypothetical protein
VVDHVALLRWVAEWRALEISLELAIGSSGMKSKFVRVGMVVFGVSLSAGVALAEETGKPSPAAGTAPAPSAPDLVKLKNGGLVRGTIAELIPSDYVVIVSLSGETKRFPMSEVEYAGPADEQPRTYPEPETAASAPVPASPAPPATRAAVTVHAAEARVTLTSEPDVRTFHRQSATATVGNAADGFVGVKGYDELCTSPCEVSMAAGTTTLAVSKPGGQVVGAAPVTIPSGHSEVHAVWVDNEGTRSTGRVLMGVGIAGAVAVLGVAVASGSNDTGMLVGLVTGTVGTSVVFGIGVGLASTSDSAKFEVRSAAAPERELKLATLEGRRLPGLTLSGAF